MRYIICQINVFNGVCDKVWWTNCGVRNNLTSKGTGVIQNFSTYGYIYRSYVTPDSYSDTLTY